MADLAASSLLYTGLSEHPIQSVLDRFARIIGRQFCANTAVLIAREPDGRRVVSTFGENLPIPEASVQWLAKLPAMPNMIRVIDAMYDDSTHAISMVRFFPSHRFLVHHTLAASQDATQLSVTLLAPAPQAFTNADSAALAVQTALVRGLIEEIAGRRVPNDTTLSHPVAEDATLIVGMNGRIKSVTPAFCALLGFEAAELLSAQTLDTLLVRRLENLPAPPASSNAPVSTPSIWGYRHRDGGVRWLSHTVSFEPRGRWEDNCMVIQIGAQWVLGEVCRAASSV